jgi:hypothetical protein
MPLTDEVRLRHMLEAEEKIFGENKWPQASFLF